MTNQSKYFWMLDPGHGGINPVTGKYTTDLKIGKQYDHGDFIIYEGVINRGICEKLRELLDNDCIRNMVIPHDYLDTSLGARVRLANVAYKTDKTAIFLSLHNNASSNLNVTGTEIFTSIGETASDDISTIIGGRFAKASGVKYRMGDYGEYDKEARYYVLTETHCPAVLIEYDFFTNYEKAKEMLTDEWQRKQAYMTYAAILDVERINPLNV